MLARLAVCCAVCLVTARLSVAQDAVNAASLLAGTELSDYVSAPDNSFDWEVREELKLNGCDVLRLHLTSQTWKGIAWRHVMYLIKPKELDLQRHDALLVIGGGSWNDGWPANGPEKVSPRGEVQLMSGVATQFGCVIAVLSHVPFQPMMGGKREDEIIAATFGKYIETKDASWPLLLPMVKSATRGMDAATMAAKENWGVDLQQFTITGASKRGWTTWLTGATDRRATVIAPMVIDMLNMNVQMKHQIDSFGTFSEQIEDYTTLNLPGMLSTERGQQLQRIVDPFAYREKLVQPKLLIFGTNDRYWPLDACNNYWEQLKGEKYLLYVPNQGHGLNDYPRVIGSISAMHRSQHGGAKLPKLAWDFDDRDASIALNIEVSGSADSVRGWTAVSETRDFREASWREVSTRQTAKGKWTCLVEKPNDGFVACFGEVVCAETELPAFFSTNVRIFKAK